MMYASEKSSLRKLPQRYPCRVCEKPAVGSFYGVLACGGCKIFYRRPVGRTKPYICVKGHGKCTTKHMETFAAGWCRACRLKKCRSVGMKIKATSPPFDGRCTGSLTDNLLYKDALRSKTISESSQAPNESEVGNYGTFFCKPNEQKNMNDRMSDFTSFWDHHQIPVANSETVRPTAVRQDANYVSGHPVSLIPENFVPSTTDSFCTHRQIPSTVQAVASAVKIVFSDQIERWTEFKKLGERRNDCYTTPDFKPESVLQIISHHCLDIVLRLNKFVSLLPGMDESNPDVVFSVTVGWKWLTCALIHHASFMNNHDTYWTIGSTEFHYSRYWQDIISDKAFVEFTYRFSSLFRDIGLCEIERYVLMAVIFFEPAQESPLHHSTVNLVHRHYTRLLFTLIKQRCGHADEMRAVYRKLECFFETLKDLHKVQQFCFVSSGRETPFDIANAAEQFRIIQSEMRSNAMNAQALVNTA